MTKAFFSLNMNITFLCAVLAVVGCVATGGDDDCWFAEPSDEFKILLAKIVISAGDISNTDRFLADKITVDRAADFYGLASENSLPILMNTATFFIRQNANDVFKTGGYLTLQTKRPQVVAELLSKLKTLGWKTTTT